MSLNEVAARGQLSPQMVGYVERLLRRPKIDILARIAWAKGKRPSALLEEAENRAGWNPAD